MTGSAAADIDARGTQLYEEGAAMLDAAWDDGAGLTARETGAGRLHDGRGSLAYAAVLLRRGGAHDVARAERIIANVAAMQETAPDDAHRGNLRWFFEDAGVTDLNAVEFALDGLNEVARLGAGVLSPATAELIRDMMALGLEEIDRLDVHPSYTNIALSDVCNSVLGGEWLGSATHIERGRRRLDDWLDFTARSGAPHEFNSPTYLGVDVNRLAFLAAETRDPEIALRARIAAERTWLHAASRYHPQLAQLAGPHSRSYRDGWTGAGGYFKLILWRLLGDAALRRNPPWYPQGREEGHTGAATLEYALPGYIERLLRRKRYPYECIETADVERGVTLSTYMTQRYALGTSSRAYTVGTPPEPWPANNGFLLHFARDEAPGYGIVFSRYVVNDRAPGTGAHATDRTAEDFWEEGVHVAAQQRNRAIVAYGLQPRMRPARSFKLRVTALGVAAGAAAWCGDAPLVEGTREMAPRRPLIVDAGGAYVALIPLAPTDMGHGAPIVVTRDGDTLTLDIYNYRGHDRQFWEYRSLAGPFFRGNVRNGFIVEAGTPAVWGSFDAFRAHVAAARISDDVDASRVRTITYASPGGEVTLRYRLDDLSLADAPIAPMGRGGAIDGSGMQWLQSREPELSLHGATLAQGGLPAVFAADRDEGLYACVNPSTERGRVRLETPGGVMFDCDALGTGRVEIDERAGVVVMDAVRPFGGVRLRGAQRLIINGEDAGL